MRFIPAPLRKLQALNWGQALSAIGYQRVQLRILCISMLMTLPIFPLMVAYITYKRMGGETTGFFATALLGTAIVIGALLLAMILWLSWMLLKISVMRWRGLGFKGAGMVAMVVLTLCVYGLINAAAEIGQRPEILLTGLIPLWIYKWLGVAVILQVVQALLSYWMYLEDTPLSTVEATVQEPYATQPGRFETTALFAQQVWVWFGILSVPMYFIVSIYN